MKCKLYQTVLSAGIFALTGMFLPCHVGASCINPPARAYESAKQENKVMVMPENFKLTLNETSLSIYKNDMAQLMVLLEDISENTLMDQQIIWKSNKKSVAMVDKTGSVLGRKPGKAIITATLNGITVSCRVTVKKAKKRGCL